MASAAATDHKWLSATTALFEAVVIEGGKVDADSFLAACKNVPPIYDAIFSPGMVASTLKKDIDHHIAGVEGVRKRYPALRFLDELITKEVADDGREKVRYKKESGTYCLLWLMRCIMFNVTLVDLVVDGKRRPSRTCADEAYQLVLRPYHGFLLGGVVSAALGMCPTREKMIAAFELSGEEDAETFIRAYVAGARRSFDAIQAFLKGADLIFPDKA